MEIRDIINVLNQNVEDVCKTLLPAGHVIGKEWRIGDIDNNPGDSLGVRMAGPKVGVWSDFATGAKGDLLDLWKAVRGQTTVEALNDIRQHFNLESPRIKTVAKKKYKKPEPIKPNINQRAIDYIVNKRKISEETIEKYKLTFTKKEIVFQYFKNGELINNKYLWYTRDGKRHFRTEKDAEPCLYGWQAIDDDTREVVITEGEFDAMAMAEYGYQALSIPFGAGNGAKNEWIENDYDLLERFETIYLCMDMDEPGQNAVGDIAKRLGIHRVRIVKLPKKDANDCLMSGVGDMQIAAAIYASEYMKPPKLRDSIEYAEKVAERLNPTIPEQYYSPQLHEKFQNVRMYPGELTIFGGSSAAGKTTFLMEIGLDLITQGHKLLIASLEQVPDQYLKKMVMQILYNPVPHKEQVFAVFERLLGGNVYVYGHIGSADREDMLETFYYAAKRYGVDYFIVDSLMKLGMNEDDYNGQKDFTNTLTEFAKEMNVHIILVAHARKLSRDTKRAGKVDIKGTGTITDMADNVMIMYRNKPKEAIIDAQEIPPADEPDAILYVDKQREMGWEGSLRFMFDKKVETFYDTSRMDPSYVFEYIRHELFDDLWR